MGIQTAPGFDTLTFRASTTGGAYGSFTFER
jgi:hypothetical protein